MIATAAPEPESTYDASLMAEHFSVARRYQEHTNWETSEGQAFVDSCEDVCTVAVAALAARAADATRAASLSANRLSASR